MATNSIKMKERQYYIDWLRILLILSVFLFHIGMIFNTWEWHIKNDIQYRGLLRYTMIFLHNWRMPLLFLISGAGTYFALGKRTTGQYLSERFKRLVIPLIAGVFLLVPVQVYIEKSNRYNSLIDYYPHMFEGIYPEGNFSWHHLWFIAYLFVIALMISPFLNYIKSQSFALLIKRQEKIFCRPLSTNLFIIPLLLSQLLLRPFFELETHDLIRDWASMAYYVIFFLAGFILLSNKDITESIRKYRFWYLSEAVIATLVMFNLPSMAGTGKFAEVIWDISSIFVGWSCGMTVIGFGKQHFNRDSKLRRLANEAIYPFYLLHQPVIVVLGYFMIKWDLPVIMKVFLITLSSFSLTVVIYWFLVRPFNYMRIIFGMKWQHNESRESGAERILNPIPVFIRNREINRLSIKNTRL